MALENVDEKMLPVKIENLISQLPPAHLLLFEKLMRLSVTILKNVEVGLFISF